MVLGWPVYRIVRRPSVAFSHRSGTSSNKNRLQPFGKLYPEIQMEPPFASSADSGGVCGGAALASDDWQVPEGCRFVPWRWGQVWRRRARSSRQPLDLIVLFSIWTNYLLMINLVSRLCYNWFLLLSLCIENLWWQFLDQNLTWEVFVGWRLYFTQPKNSS